MTSRRICASFLGAMLLSLFLYACADDTLTSISVPGHEELLTEDPAASKTGAQQFDVGPLPGLAQDSSWKALTRKMNLIGRPIRDAFGRMPRARFLALKDRMEIDPTSARPPGRNGAGLPKAEMESVLAAAYGDRAQFDREVAEIGRLVREIVERYPELASMAGRSPEALHGAISKAYAFMDRCDLAPELPGCGEGDVTIYVTDPECQPDDPCEPDGGGGGGTGGGTPPGTSDPPSTGCQDSESYHGCVRYVNSWAAAKSMQAWFRYSNCQDGCDQIFPPANDPVANGLCREECAGRYYQELTLIAIEAAAAIAGCRIYFC